MNDIIPKNISCYYIALGACYSNCYTDVCQSTLDISYALYIQNGNTNFEKHLSADEDGLFYLGIVF